VNRALISRLHRFSRLFLLSSLCVAVYAGAEAQMMPDDGWYVSDSLGMAYEPVAGPKDAPWTLERVRIGASHRATLYKDGVAFKTTSSEYGHSGALRREAVEEEGLLLEESTFDADGRPLLVRLFLPDGLVEETSYEYTDGRLLSRKTTRGGEIVETTNYIYSPDGRLVSAKASSGVFYGSGKTAGGVSSMWRKGPDGLELRGYDATGRLATIQLYDGSSLKSSETRSWAGERLERSLLVTSDGTGTLTEYAVSGAAAGNIIAITVDRDGLLVSSQKNSYDDSGRLQRVETETRDKRTITEYAYDDQGILAVEKRFLDLDQTLVIRYESKTDKIEETYLKNVLLARVSYRDGRRVKEELFKDGIPVRTRIFE